VLTFKDYKDPHRSNPYWGRAQFRTESLLRSKVLRARSILQSNKVMHSDGKVACAAQKPFALIEGLILSLTNVGDIILDLMGATGVTPLASVMLQRPCVVNDIEQRAYEVMVRRLEEFKSVRREALLRRYEVPRELLTNPAAPEAGSWLADSEDYGTMLIPKGFDDAWTTEKLSPMTVSVRRVCLIGCVILSLVYENVCDLKMLKSA